MRTLIRPAVTLLLLMTVLLGIVYPVVITGIAKVAFPNQAAGSLVMKNGKAIGSTLIGQNFTAPKYFWGRPSATGNAPYNGVASAGSNLGPLNPALTDAIKARVEALRAADPGNNASVPVDLVTASGSGLDPEISVAAAQYQLARVAKARGLTNEAVQKLIDAHTQGRRLGFLGEPRVNVLELNLALDSANL
jgi:K+-transporting ATPase ATPase C chain